MNNEAKPNVWARLESECNEESGSLNITQPDPTRPGREVSPPRDGKETTNSKKPKSVDRFFESQITMSAVLSAGGGLTAGDRSILTAINTGASSLSFVGSTFIVLCYCLFKELRKFSFKLVFYLALSVSFSKSKIKVDLGLFAESKKVIDCRICYAASS